MKNAPEKITDIARHLGLSRPTVSYILNDKWKSRGISEATAKKVLSYIEETGFKPNIAGLALRGKACKELAILMPVNPTDHQKLAFFSLLKFLEASHRSYFVLPTSKESLGETIKFLKMYKVKRLIIIALWMCYGAGEWEAISKWLDGVNYLLYDFPFEVHKAKNYLLPGNNLAVGFNRDVAKAKALRNIVDNGYKDIFLPRSIEFHTLDGLIPSYGLNVEYYETPELATLFELGESIAKQLLNRIEPGKRKAVYIHDDKVSFAAIKLLLDNGVKVPEQMAVASWDGLPESNYFSVPLTTLVVPHEKMMSCTLDWLDGKPFKERQMVFDAEIRQGKSLPPVGQVAI